MKLIKWLCSQPFVLGAAVLAALLFLTPTSDLTFIRDTLGGGALIKVLTAVIAGLTLMGLVKLATLMRVLFSDGALNGIAKDPVAKAVLLAGLYVAFALVVASIFG